MNETYSIKYVHHLVQPLKNETMKIEVNYHKININK